MSYLKENAKTSAYSYEELATHFGVTVHAVSTAIRQLVKKGAPIEKHYALVGSPVGKMRQRRVFLSIKKSVKKAKLDVSKKTLVEVNELMERLKKEGKEAYLDGTMLIVEEFKVEEKKEPVAEEVKVAAEETIADKAP
jgi:DNA-binding MarR family transcriptional regulator